MDLEMVIQDNLEGGNDDEEEIQLTPAEIIEIMEEAWVNEKFAPEILPHKLEIVDCLLGQIAYMENNIQGLDNTDFTKSIHQLEVDRLRFLVSSYLRTRLEKIETYATLILEQENLRIQQGVELYLTEQELKFARDFSEGLQQHFENVTSYYPRFPREEWSQETVKPNIHSFVFLKSKENIKGMVLEGNTQDGKIFDLTCGAQVIISYKTVSDLVKKGDVHLI